MLRPHLRKLRQFENVFITVILATGGEEGEEEEEGVEEVTPHCLLCHSHWRVTPTSGAVSPAAAGGQEGCCSRGALASVERWWSFWIYPVCLRSRMYSSRGVVSQSQLT